MIWDTLRLSIIVVSIATAVIAIAGTALGWLLAKRDFRGKVLRHHIEDGTTTVDVNSCLIETPLNSLTVGSTATIGIRSEDIIVSREHLTQISARNVLKGSIKSIFSNINKTELVVHCGIDFKVSITQAAVRELKLDTGSTVYLLIKARAVHLLE